MSTVRDSIGFSERKWTWRRWAVKIEPGTTNFSAVHSQTRNRILDTVHMCTIDRSAEFEESDEGHEGAHTHEYFADNVRMNGRRSTRICGMPEEPEMCLT